MALNPNIKPLALNPNLGGLNKTSTQATPFSAQVKSPYSQLQSDPNRISQDQFKPQPPQTTPGGIDYRFHLGESIDAYYQRTQGQSQKQALAQTTPGQSLSATTQITPNPPPANNPPPQNQGTPGFQTVTNPANGAPMAVPMGGSYNANGSVNQDTSTPVPNPQPYQLPPNPNANPYTSNAPQFGATAGALATQATQPSPEFVRAQQSYQNAADQLQQTQADFANQNKNIMGSRTNLSEAGGEQGLLINAFNQQQASYAQRMDAAARQAQAATGQQSIQQQGLYQAGNLVRPDLGQYGQTYYQPTMAGKPGGGTAGGGGQPVSQSDPFYKQMQTYAQAYADNQMSAVPASVSGNPALQAQLLDMAKQINPNFNVNTAQGAGTSANDLTQQSSQIQSVFNGAEANFKLLVDTARQGGVNDTNVPMINALQQNISRGLTSSAAVTNFRNTLATVRSQYAQILGGGSSTVDSNQRAAQAIPDDISLGALQSLEIQLQSEAKNRIAGINQQVKSLQGNQGSSSSFKEGQKSTDGSIVYKGGKWVANQ